MKIIDYYATLEKLGERHFDDRYVSGKISTVVTDAVSLIDIDVKCRFSPYGFTHIFQNERSFVLKIDISEFSDVLGQKLYSPFWAAPVLNGLSDRMQHILLRRGDKYVFVLPISNSSVNTFINRTEKNVLEISVNTMSHDYTEIHSPVAISTEAESPYDAIRRGYEYAAENRLILTALKRSKSFPDALNYLGWCTWNALGNDVCEEKIISKFAEFKEKNIPVRWLLIDDGWQETDGFYMVSPFENKEKFPHGIKHTVDILKSEYNVLYVGVWHSATGYWHGLKNECENSFKTDAGVILPDGYEFFGSWHRYLREQGIDFIKVDCQGNLVEYLKNNYAALKKVQGIQIGLEESAHENFDFMINCMGLNNVNTFSRTHSSVIRSSDDFYPDKPDSLRNHIEQNVYNALFYNDLFYCDFDMFCSKHLRAKQNAVLRAISGGSFCITDELGESSCEFILPFVDESGKKIRFDNCARPTRDCIFGYDKAIKVFNTYGQNGAVAVFAFEDETTVHLSASDFMGDRTYKVRSVLSEQDFILRCGESFDITLSPFDCDIFIFDKSVDTKR